MNLDNGSPIGLGQVERHPSAYTESVLVYLFEHVHFYIMHLCKNIQHPSLWAGINGFEIGVKAEKVKNGHYTATAVINVSNLFLI